MSRQSPSPLLLRGYKQSSPSSVDFPPSLLLADKSTRRRSIALTTPFVF